MSRPEVVRKGSLRDAEPTPGIVRKEAFASDGIWAGVATTDPGVTSGWHHHGDHTTYLCVISGRFRLESGPGGRDVVEGGPGDFFKIPPRTIHRESNPTTEEAEVVLVRTGAGPVVVNVEGPEA